MLPQTWMANTLPEKQKQIQIKQTKSKDKENNEGCLPQALMTWVCPTMMI
jgi:hypothetical protein